MIWAGRQILLPQEEAEVLQQKLTQSIVLLTCLERWLVYVHALMYMCSGRDTGAAQETELQEATYR